MSISYEHYRTFYYVGKYENLTIAAKFLFSSQPNISRTIALLEREYGCRLIERSNRGVKLTPENNKNGFELCDKCDKELHDEIKADKAKREGKR